MTVGKFVRASTISDGWYRGLDLIWNHGDVLKDERGSKTKELLNLTIVIENPYRDMIPKDSPWNEERLDEYAKQFVTGKNVQDFEYTYGQRLRDWNGIDQIEYAVRKLKKVPNSRRAISITWMPPKDTRSNEVPCMMLIDFKLRDSLNLTTVFRSHDFYGAAPNNWYALARLLEYVAKRIGAKPGIITSVSISAHIYEHDWDDVSAILE